MSNTINLNGGHILFTLLFRTSVLVLTHLWLIWLSNLFSWGSRRLLRLTSLHGRPFLQGALLCLSQLQFFFNNLPVFFVFLISQQEFTWIHAVAARLFREVARWCNRNWRLIFVSLLYFLRDVDFLVISLGLVRVILLFSEEVAEVTRRNRDFANLWSFLSLIYCQNCSISASWINLKTVFSHHDLVVVELIFVFQPWWEIRSWVWLLRLHDYF